jgi:putative ABC transport system permease protein
VFAATRRLNGVAAVQPMMHRFAYVGNDLQDLFGINPRTISTATPISDAFFPGGSSSATLAALAARPDAVLVSEETVLTYQLRTGDLLRLRLQSARDHAYHLVPFHFVGVVREFPTAPKDSFFIANASYIARVTGSPAYQDMLVRTNGPPPAVARHVRHVLGPASGAVVQDLSSQLKITLSGLTALDLSGLTRLELAFAFILAAAASGLVLALGLVERRRTFAIAAALGARSRQLASFVWSEAIYVTMGVLSGWALSFVIIKILTGVFDPPPPHLFVPWAYLTALGGVTCGAIAATGTSIIRAVRRPSAGIIRDL